MARDPSRAILLSGWEHARQRLRVMKTREQTALKRIEIILHHIPDAPRISPKYSWIMRSRIAAIARHEISGRADLNSALICLTASPITLME
jgi:hypothetical protein